MHGGLKPTNILIAENGQACIADFGMVDLDPSGNASSHRYFSPEAWKGVSILSMTAEFLVLTTFS